MWTGMQTASLKGKKDYWPEQLDQAIGNPSCYLSIRVILNLLSLVVYIDRK